VRVCRTSAQSAAANKRDKTCERSSVGATSRCSQAITAVSCAKRTATSGPTTYLVIGRPSAQCATLGDAPQA
jgi:hypothetical protein